MHLFNGVAVMQGEIQFMSGHGNILSRLASAPGEEAGAAQGNVAHGPSWPLLPSIPGLWVGMVQSYSLLLRGDGLSAVTVARAESLAPTGRGPALRATQKKAPRSASCGGRDDNAELISSIPQTRNGICPEPRLSNETTQTARMMTSPAQREVPYSPSLQRLLAPQGRGASAFCAALVCLCNDGKSQPVAAWFAPWGEWISRAPVRARALDPVVEGAGAELLGPSRNYLSFDRGNSDVSSFSLLASGLFLGLRSLRGHSNASEGDLVGDGTGDVEHCPKLTVLANESYSVGAAAKSAAEIGVSQISTEPTHAPIAWFFVGTRSPFLGVLLAYPAFGILCVMAVRARAPQGALGSVVTSYANLVRAATSWRLASLSGSKNLTTTEAAIMATVPTPLTPVVRVIDGQAVTTSLDLAEYFGKNHRDVLRKIDTLDCSLDFIERNFALISYTDGLGRKKPCYQLTRDGFFFVAMGFTGRRAAEFKEAYIAAFNAMEQRLCFPDYLAQLDQAHLRDAVSATLQHLAVIRQAWDEQLYPGLKALGSPLAVSLHDRVHLACWSLQTIAKHSGCELTMNEALAATRPPVFPRAQACGLRAGSVGGQRRQGGRHE
ncbi:Rha family transcriptional regulator [Aeromonas rivipollensis]|uniref:Rha family phage regulatory protein n=1 Tax=Aeromonas rivipollensis TaxID=948519 RepID=UPI0039856F45